jgi:hypothetical protein
VRNINNEHVLMDLNHRLKKDLNSTRQALKMQSRQTLTNQQLLDLLQTHQARA